MKYTILLTPKEKDTLECVLEIVRRYIGFSVKLEPIEKTWESELAEAKEYAYKKGFEDGKADATNTDMIDELKQVEYNKGYNSAINDYNAMNEWLHDCFVEADVIERSKIDKVIEEIKNITPRATIRTGKTNTDSTLMIPLDKVLEILEKNLGE